MTENTRKLRYTPQHEEELARTRQDFRIFMQSFVMTDHTCMVSAQHNNVSVEEYVDAATLGAFLCAMRNLASAQNPSTFGHLRHELPRIGLHQLLDQVLDHVEGQMKKNEPELEQELRNLARFEGTLSSRDS